MITHGNTLTNAFHSLNRAHLAQMPSLDIAFVVLATKQRGDKHAQPLFCCLIYCWLTLQRAQGLDAVVHGSDARA